MTWAINGLNRLAELTCGLGVKLVYENHAKPGAWTYTDYSQPPEIFLRIARGTAHSGIGINFDTGNAAAFAADPVALLDQVIDRVVSVHAADTAARGELRHVALGTGVTPYAALFGRLHQAGWDGWICMEEASCQGVAGVAAAADFVRRTWAQAGIAVVQARSVSPRGAATMPTIVFLHTVLSVIPQFSQLCRELLPADIAAWHIGDEILARVAVEQGKLSPFLYRRVADHVVAAEVAGASLVQLTCSSISPCVDPVRHLVGIPVLKVDEPMVNRALSIGSRIGLVATAPTALRPTTALIATRAAVLGKQAAIDGLLCNEAYAYLVSGDLETHDRIVRASLLQLLCRNDVVLLAQASMAHVADTISAEERLVPILSSPRLAVERLRDVLKGLPVR